MTETTEAQPQQDWDQETYAILYGYAETIAHSVHRSYPMVEVDDLLQEALMWAVQHPVVLGNYLGHPEGAKKVTQAMKNACRDYAVKQRALARGDESFIDDAWYPLEALKGTGRTASKRGLLHHVFDQNSWTNPEKPEASEGRTKRDPAEGNNWLATLADVSSALDKLPPTDYALIVLHYKQGYTYEEIGGELNPPVSRETVSKRMDRAVRKVQDALGGPRPRQEPEENGWEDGLVGTRHAISNAHARALTGADYDE